MRGKNSLIAAVVIAAATALVIAFSIYKPQYAAITLLVYFATVFFLSVMVFILSSMYDKHRSSIDTKDFVAIAEHLNIEIMIWADDYSFIYLNKRIRQLLEVDYDGYDRVKDSFRLHQYGI